MLDDGVNLRRRFFDFQQNRRDFEAAKRAEKSKKNIPNYSFQPKLDMKSRHLVPKTPNPSGDLEARDRIAVRHAKQHSSVTASSEGPRVLGAPRSTAARQG